LLIDTYPATINNLRVKKRANYGGSSEHRMIGRYIKSTASKQWMNISLQASTDDPMHEFIHVDKSN
jgi:hypothetical protein